MKVGKYLAHLVTKHNKTQTNQRFNAEYRLFTCALDGLQWMTITLGQIFSNILVINLAILLPPLYSHSSPMNALVIRSIIFFKAVLKVLFIKKVAKKFGLGVQYKWLILRPYFFFKLHNMYRFEF